MSANSDPLSAVVTPTQEQSDAQKIAGIIQNGIVAEIKNLIDLRNRYYRATWGNSPGPVAIFAAHGPQGAAIIDHDRDIVAYLVTRLVKAGMPQDQALAMFPGIPAKWVVTISDVDHSVSVTLAPAASSSSGV